MYTFICLFLFFNGGITSPDAQYMVVYLPTFSPETTQPGFFITRKYPDRCGFDPGFFRGNRSPEGATLNTRNLLERFLEGVQNEEDVVAFQEPG